MAETVGIDSLKKLVIALVDVSKVTVEQLKDGWQTSDLWPIIMEGKDLTMLVTNSKEIVAEFKDLSKDEVTALVDAIVAEIGLEPGAVLEVIKAAIAFAESGYALFEAVKVMYPAVAAIPAPTK